ncbi:hypothetical protein [Actinoplanes subglobosus]|uniref:Uncharacterized protein n=1 Tax=Actinoplanes subglobosus TaxID=1547892 RepID=A0ABV8J6C9_9ACTN
MRPQRLREAVLELLTTSGTEVRRLMTVVDAAIAGVPPRWQSMSYTEVIRFLVDGQARLPDARCGVVLRRGHRDGGFQLCLFFLDEQSEIVTDSEGQVAGMRCAVDELDEELADTFGSYDVIVVV